MPLVIAVWPNNSISMIQCPTYFTMTELFWAVDEEGDPSLAKLYLIKPESGWSHATFDFTRCSDQPEFQSGVIRVIADSGKVRVNSGKRKRLRWPANIIRDAWRYMGFKSDAWETLWQAQPEDGGAEIQTMSAAQILEMPAEPVNLYSVKEVRAMPKFCGVYLAFNEDGSCHYVGESEDVPDRVRSGRKEIGSRKIGFVRCEPHERRRIEAYFVAMLDPPGNGISTHRMLQSAQEKNCPGTEAQCQSQP